MTKRHGKLMIYAIYVDGHAFLLIYVVFISLYMNKSYLLQIVRVRKDKVLILPINFDINNIIKISCRSDGLKHLKRTKYLDKH